MRTSRWQRSAGGATSMWLAAVGARLAWLVQRRPSADASPSSYPRVPPFEHLQQVLREAAHWPAGRAGDAIRRAACEFIEAASPAARHSSRRRMLKTIASVEWRRGRRRSRADDPSELSVKRLIEALGVEAQP